MPTSTQLQKIWHLSDTVLYSEAIALVHRLVEKERHAPLPPSQITGLLNVAHGAKYADLARFIIHQRDRDWPSSKSNIRPFYTELDKIFTRMKNERLKQEFRLLREGLSVEERRKEIDELMALLAREFIQHLIAENGLLAARVPQQAHAQWQRQRR